jgi:uncharacterized membrane protein
LSLLLGVLVLGHGLLLGGFLGDGSSLALLDFSHGFLSKGFLFLGTGILELFDVVKSHTFNGSLLSEHFSLFIFSLVSLL